VNASSRSLKTTVKIRRVSSCDGTLPFRQHRASHCRSPAGHQHVAVASFKTVALPLATADVRSVVISSLSDAKTTPLERRAVTAD